MNFTNRRTLHRRQKSRHARLKILRSYCYCCYSCYYYCYSCYYPIRRCSWGCHSAILSYCRNSILCLRFYWPGFGRG